MSENTTISVREATADRLYSLKNRGESYDEMLRRELGLEEVEA